MQKVSKLVFLLFAFTILNCSKKEEYIELTSGIYMNPLEPRFGIKIVKNKVFYCEEIIKKNRRTGIYNYYELFYSPNMTSLKIEVSRSFNRNFITKPIPDGEIKKLRYCINGKFYESFFFPNQLNSIQLNVYYKILSIPKLKKRKKSYYKNYNNELLEEELPPPPPAPGRSF